MGYWKTHTGLDKPKRDATYDLLPILLGIGVEDAYPEALVETESEARAVFQAASSDGLGEKMLMAQLLAAKLNVLRFAGFSSALFPSGESVASVIHKADVILDDLANGVPHTKEEIVAIKDLLDAANNNGHVQVLNSCPLPSE